MNTKSLSAVCARKMQIEYLRTRKDLAKKLKTKLSPEKVKPTIDESFLLLNDRLSAILVLYITKASIGGKRDAEKEFKDIVRAAAPELSLSKQASGKAIRRNIGAIGKYNTTLSKTLKKQYDTLLSDNRLSNSLKKDGWSPWMGETLKKQGIDPKVISLIKQQTTSTKMMAILNQQGIRGGLHPDQVGRRLEPFVNRYFGPGGVEIDNVGKTVTRIHVDADGNFKWVNHKVTRKYKATTRTYSRLLARSSMKQAHQDAYYESLKGTNLVDHFISVSVLDARTCGICAMMHGQPVSKAEGPIYHGNCHCDLKPIWKADGLLGDKNKDPTYYTNQRDKHFLAVDDLTRYNMHMPSGSKVKYYTMLPSSAQTKVMPGVIKMRAMRNRMLGMPSKIASKPATQKGQPPVEPDSDKDNWLMTNDEWKKEADKLWVKTKADGKEHLRLYNGKSAEFAGTKNSVTYVIPKHSFSAMHTHPGWDSPLSAQDLISFLNQPRAKFEAACSNNAIYIVRKKPGYKSVRHRKDIDNVINVYETERKRLIAVATKANKIPDMTELSLKAGRKVCKDYGLEYKVIIRNP